MEIILSKRNKALAYLLFLFLIIALFYLFRFNNYSKVKDEYIEKYVNSSIKRVETLLKNRRDSINKRSKLLYKKYVENKIEQADLMDGEALIFVEKGVIRRYYGEIFYFKPMDNTYPLGSVIFLKKESKIYYLKKIEKGIYYLNIFCDISSDIFNFKKDIPFSYSEIKFSDTSVNPGNTGFHSDIVKGTYHFYKNLEPMNDQMFLTLKFLRWDFIEFFKAKKEISNTLILLIFLLVLFFLFEYKSDRVILKSLYFILFNVLIFVLIVRISGIYSFKELFIEEYGTVHLVLLLYLSVLFFLLMRYLVKSQKYLRIKIVFSLILIDLFPWGMKYFLQNVSFPYAKFTVFGLSSALIIISFVFIKSVITFLSEVIQKLTEYDKYFFMFFFILTGLAISYFSGLYFLIYLILFFIIFFTLYFRKNIFVDIVNVMLISISLFLILFTLNSAEKERYVSSGLKDIFANQNNYAKFISREIIHNFNLKSNDLSYYFRKDAERDLEYMWRSSIAAKENISSGIYVVDNKGELINSFSYRIPYLNIEIKKFFPFWEIDEFNTVYYGNTVSLAVAYINVFSETEYLGRIVIQVLDSSDLIVKDRNSNNIFLLNKRIEGKNLSYIKLNSDDQIVENPSNIALHEINKIVSSPMKWIKFRSMNTIFRGYVFKTDKNTIIIFYPALNPSDISADIIRIFLLLLIVNIFFDFQEIISLNWRIIYRTFSFRVFSILILLSFITAVFFSVFTFQYNRKSINLTRRNQIYNSDGIASNIISDLLDREGRLEQNNLFFLSKILDSDISVYLNDELTDTSNYKKILNSEIPLFINSGISESLKLKKERFIIKNNGERYSSFFRIYNYTVRIDHPYGGTSGLTNGRSFINFIVNLFFILTLLGIFLAVIFRNKIIFPINMLNRKMAEVEKGELVVIDDIPDEIEIRDLFSGFNSMVKGIINQRKKISEISRMKILVKISRWIAHEVKNPLTPIKLSAEQILRAIKDKRDGYEEIVQESVNYIITETEHLKNISYGFLDFSNLNELKRENFDIVEICRKEMGKLQKVFKRINFKVESDYSVLNVFLDKTKIKQVLKNILSNSIEAMPERRGDITVKIEIRDNSLILLFTDTGVGLAEHKGEDLFSEEFSSKEKGTGLGLFIVKRIVELHGGGIKIGENEYGNTVVTIAIPEESFKSGDKERK